MSCPLPTCQICFSLIHRPIVSAAISGNIISLSPVSSATPTISAIIARAEQYLIFFLGTLSIYAQKEYCFQYDSAGNQRSALLCLNGKDDATDEELFDELPEALKSSETDNSSKITLQGAPNPVTDNLAVYWHHSENGVLTQLVVFSVDGKMMYRTDQIPANEPFHINVSTWSVGYYFLVATFSDGSRKVFKVVKQ